MPKHRPDPLQRMPREALQIFRLIARREGRTVPMTLLKTARDLLRRAELTLGERAKLKGR